MALPAYGVKARKRARLASELITLGFLSLASCRTPQPAATSVTVAYPQGLSGSEPNRGIEEFSLSILSNVFEGLVDVDGSLALRPALAESWTSPDDLSWEFHLRPGVIFHDGSALRADLVVDCLEELRRDTARDLSPALAEVSEILAKDPLTVVLHTRVPVPSLPYHLGSLFIAKRGAAGQRAVGSGPYRLENSTAAGDATLAAFDGYWGGRPAISTLHFRVLSRPEERVQALRQGEVDLAVDVPAGEVAALEGDAHLRVVTARGLRVIFLGAVSARGDGVASTTPLADGRVRRALALAIDRDRLAREAMGGHAEVIDQLIAPEIFGYSAELPRIPYDPETARKLLATAGYPEGLGLTLDFPAERYRAIDAVARQVVDDLSRIGIRVVPNARSSDMFFARLARREPELYLMGWICNGDAPLSYDYLLHRREGSRGSDNYTGLADPALDRLIESTELEPLIAPRGAQLRLIAEHVLRDLPLIPLYRQFDLYGVRAGLEFHARPDRRIRGIEMRWR